MNTDQVVVDLLGVECNTDVADADGCVWTVSDIAGWDAPSQRSQQGEPTAQHGGYGMVDLANGRALVVTGRVIAPTQDAAWLAYYRLAASMPGINGDGDVVVSEPVPKSLTVRQSGPPRMTQPIGGSFEYQLSLVADYPWKRGLTATTVAIAAGATVSVAHAGTFPAEFTATTTSTGTVSLSAGGLTLSSASVASGTVFDSQDFSITSSGGADLYGSIGVGAEWPAVEVGSHDWVNAGTADVELSFYPTFS